MSKPPQITLEDGLTALREVGCRPTEDRAAWLCPRCRVAELTIAQNGAGPHFDCAGDCGDLGAYLATLVNGLPRGRAPKGDHVDEIEVVRDKLNLPELERIVKDGRLGDHYSFVLTDGRSVAIGPVSTLTSQAKFRNAFLPQMRRQAPRFKASDWDDVVERIEKAADERDTIATAEEEALGWIGGWVGRIHAPIVDTGDSGQVWDVLAAPAPAFRAAGGRLWIRLPDLLTWIERQTSTRITLRELSLRLARLGFTKPDDGGQLTARRGSEKRQARYWISPANFEATR